MKNTAIKSIKDVLGLLGEQMEQLRPAKKPSQSAISAAKASATVVNSYLGTVKLGMEYARMKGAQPDLDFLGISTQSKIAQ